MSLNYGKRAKKIKNTTSINKDLTNGSDLQMVYAEVEYYRNSLLARTKEFERIKAEGDYKSEENEQLKVFFHCLPV